MRPYQTEWNPIPAKTPGQFSLERPAAASEYHHLKIPLVSYVVAIHFTATSVL